MDIIKLIRFTLYTYILVLIGVIAGVEFFGFTAYNIDVVLLLIVWLFVIIAINALLTGTIRNISNYIIIGSVFGVFVYLVISDVQYIQMLLASGVGIALTAFILIWIKLQWKHPLIYLITVLIVIGWIAYQILNSADFGYVLSLLFFILVVPFLNLINISNFIHNKDESFFQKNPLILAIFPLFLVAMPSTEPVLVPTPLEIETDKEDEDEEEKQL